MLTINFATRALLALAIALVAAGAIFAQAWSAKLDDKVRFYQVTDVGALIVGTKKSLYAVDGMTGDILWRHRTRTPPNTATLTTGGGLVVVGDFDRYLYVHDAATGKILFQTRLSTSVQGFPITYAVNGRQFLAIPVGTGGGQWVTTIPSELTPEKKIAPGSNAIFVFALPEVPQR